MCANVLSGSEGKKEKKRENTKHKQAQAFVLHYVIQWITDEKAQVYEQINE